MEYYSAIKNELMLFAATRIQLAIIILSKSKRERQIPYDITYMWNLKYDTNELICKQKETHRHRGQTCYQGGGKWWREDLGLWYSRYKLVYGWISNKVLLYSCVV